MTTPFKRERELPPASRRLIRRNVSKLIEEHLFRQRGKAYNWLGEALVTRQGHYSVQLKIPTHLGNYYLEIEVREPGVKTPVRSKR